MKDGNTICIIIVPTSEAAAATSPCRLTSAAATLLPSLGGDAAARPFTTATLRAPRGWKASWSNHLGEGPNTPGLGISSHMNGTWPRRGWRARCWGATLQGADMAALAGARLSTWVTEGLTHCVHVRVCGTFNHTGRDESHMWASCQHTGDFILVLFFFFSLPLLMCILVADPSLNRCGGDISSKLCESAQRGVLFLAAPEN